MKRLFLFGMALMLAFTASTQNNVTRFLGIPVDGTKTAMIQKLKAKGYTYNSTLDYLQGEFNGRDVRIYVVTNNNKVWRIMVSDTYPTRNKADIRIRFNTLCGQFSKNEKYIPANMLGEYEISESEDISVQMTLYNKRYEAAYYQVSEADKDTTGLQEWALGKISKKYTEAEIKDMSEEETKQVTLSLLLEYINEKLSKKSVWFMI